jgi:uncharacterized protein (DUF305 family)
MGLIQMPGGSHQSSADDTMTEEQMQKLDEANGVDGQRLFLEGMIRHHQGAIKMAQAEIASIRIRMRSCLPRTSLKASKPRWPP